MQQEVLVNYLIGEDALEIGNFERAKILDLLEFGENPLIENGSNL